MIRNYFSLSSLIIFGAIIGLIGIIAVKVFPNISYAIPRDDSLPPEEEQRPPY